MKKREIKRLVTFALLIASITLVSSCKKIQLSWPPWKSSEKKAGSEAAGYDWPRWRGPDGNGISKETEWDPTILESGPHVLWRHKVGFGYSNVVVKGSHLYTMGSIERK